MNEMLRMYLYTYNHTTYISTGIILWMAGRMVFAWAQNGMPAATLYDAANVQ